MWGSRRGGRTSRAGCGAAVACLASLLGAGPVAAQTMPSALVHAYQTNPQLNAQRAQVRVTDEAVPQALSGFRPRLSVTASASHNYVNQVTKPTDPVPGNPSQLFVVDQPATLKGDF